jgi:H+/Cl- antiporter ClcA
MPFATLLFYAIASFFLGLVAIATGGASVLQSIFAPSTFVLGGSHEPWQTILNALVLAIPLVFLGLAVLSIFVRPVDAPATAADIRELIAALERNGERDTQNTDTFGAYRRS